MNRQTRMTDAPEASGSPIPIYLCRKCGRYRADMIHIAMNCADYHEFDVLRPVTAQEMKVLCQLRIRAEAVARAHEEERAKWQMARDHDAIRYARIEGELEAVEAERDRFKEALEKILEVWPQIAPIRKIATAALEKLRKCGPNEKP